MISEVEQYSSEERYTINPTKSNILNYNSKVSVDYKIYGENIKKPEKTEHLGILRDTRHKPDVEGKIKLSRRTVYSLMGAGLHGKTGIAQRHKVTLWNMYVIPRVTFGLEVFSLKAAETRKLESHQTSILKQIQHLPVRTATAAAQALLGIPPVETVIHRNTLNMFFNVITSVDSVEWEIALRQLAVRDINSKSWFSYVRRLLQQYKLPTAYNLIALTPGPKEWKKNVKNAINKYVEEEWTEEIKEKSSLKYINAVAVTVGRPHQVYRYVRLNAHDVARAEMKAKLLTGMYTLQSNRAVFNQYRVDDTCKVCLTGREDRQHFIAECTAYNPVRVKVKRKLQKIIAIRQVPELCNDPKVFTHLMLDSSHSEVAKLVILEEEDLDQLELYSREFLYKIHLTRTRLLALGHMQSTPQDTSSIPHN